MSVIKVCPDLSLRDARLWAVWSSMLHSVVFTSIHKSDCDKMVKVYNLDSPHLYVVRFDVSPLYKPLTPCVGARGIKALTTTKETSK